MLAVLNPERQEILRRQIGTSRSWGGRRYLPFAFTEQGVAMLASVLRGSRAVQVNIEIVRAFVRLRHMLATNADLARKLAALEQRYDSQFRVVFDAIRELMNPPAKAKRRIGFRGRGLGRPSSPGPGSSLGSLPFDLDGVPVF
jgi:hypothetical protein